MKRFFDLSLLLLIPMLALYSFNTVSESTTPTISKEAQEIYEIITTQTSMEITLEDIQNGLDNKTVLAAAPTLPCDPPNGCYHQGHLDRFLLSFGCCTPDCQWPCLDFNEDGCITAADLGFLLGNYCPA